MSPVKDSMAAVEQLIERYKQEYALLSTFPAPRSCPTSARKHRGRVASLCRPVSDSYGGADDYPAHIPLVTA
jgi:hypothetical protein